MILELNGTKVTIADKTLGYQGDNLVNTIQVTVDKDSTWNYKLDMYKGKSKCFDSVLMTREGNVCTVQLTNEILSYGGRYIFQLRGYTDTQTYHSDIFESWVNASIEYQGDCKQACECDCKLPTEFYQVEDNVTEINNHPPYPGDNGKWMIWDVDKHEYVESDIEVIGGDDYQTKANLTTSITQASTDEQYPSAKATYNYGQSIKSLGITSAAVGDIVKVKAVDESGKPTEWEAAGGVDIWETIANYTAAEAASWLTINKDANGNAFSLRKVKVEIILPNAVGAGLWYLYLSPSSQFFGTTGISSAGNSTVRIQCEAESDDIVTLAIKRDKNDSNDLINLVRSADYTAITAVRLGNWSNLTFPAGAKVLVKGVRT